jgi:hypothetical protein
MKKRTAVVAVAALCALGVLVGAFMVLHGEITFAPDADRLLLLLPDGTSFSDPRVTVWVDAADEEGLHVVPIHDSTYLSPLSGRPRCAGLILPDTIHVKVSDVLITAIRNYVANGGKLMLVYDAGIQSLQGFYAKDQSRLSDLAGVNYALYSSLGAGMIQSSDVRGTIALMNQLGVPPGKYYPLAPRAVEGDPPEKGATNTATWNTRASSPRGITPVKY